MPDQAAPAGNSGAIIQRALASATDTRVVQLRPGVIDQTGEIFRQLFGEAPACLVADENTYQAAGSQVVQALRRAGVSLAFEHIFPGSPTLAADIEHVETLHARFREVDAIPVAVGSGTINDLVKLAAYHAGRPYAAVGTAASMDGYTAFAAAITHQGVKKVDNCPAPRLFLADLEVMSAAPREMSSAGYGDLIAKVVSGADWMISDALGVEPIHQPAWDLIQPSLRQWVSSPQGIPEANPQVMEHLACGLVMAGLAMQAARSSWPASGSEHLFSHLWEMTHPGHAGRPVAHGFKVGLGTIASAALYHQILQQEPGDIDLEKQVREWPAPQAIAAHVRQQFPGSRLADSAADEYLVKHPGSDGLRRRLSELGRVWPVLRRRLGEQVMAPEQIAAQLAQAGCPVHPAQIGLSLEELRWSYQTARYLRRRYTLLDLAAEAGWLDPALDKLFSAGGFWAAARP
jgi:glycerol-1-phosphate dehydrogenase [NAD(P)+]